MTAVTAPAGYHVTIGGDVSGQVAVGEHIVQIGSVHGGIVYVAQPGQTAAPRPRPTPIWLRPRRFPGLLDRAQESRVATAALRDGGPVEFYGESGIGKTALLRHLAFHLPVEDFPDGIIYLRVAGRALDDIQQNLYDTFYLESDIPLKPALAQLRHALHDKAALILLDDVGVARADLDALLDVAPNCAFLLATETRRLWGEGQALALSGLPPAEALALLERELGRSLAAGERTAAPGLVARLQGHPLRLRQAASLARDQGLSLAQLENTLPAGGQELVTQSVATLPERERRVVLALAAAGSWPLKEQHLAALAGVPEAGAVLPALEQRGLVQLQGQQVTLPGVVAAALQQAAGLETYRTRALAIFTQVAEGQPAALAAGSDAVRHLLRWALDSGRAPEALRLVRAVEESVARARLWDAWKELLQMALEAAQASDDIAAEAWAWHQLGTRALCLEETEAARAALLRALRLRQGLGERAAAAVTRHNLNILLGGPPPNGEAPPPPDGSAAAWAGMQPLPVLALVTAVVVVILVTLLALNWPQPSRAESGATAAPLNAATGTPTNLAVIAPTSTPTHTVTSTSTLTPTDTATHTPTHTPTHTATPCRPAPPSSWVSYVVQRGDTLFSLAAATGTTVDVIQQVNCLEGPLIAGTAIWLPPRPTATFTPAPDPADVVVSAMQVTGPVTVAPYSDPGSGSTGPGQLLIQAPLRIVVANQGDLEAEIFKVTTAIDGFGQRAGTVFVRPGEFDWPFTAAPLAGGSQVAIDGVALFPVDLQGQTITLLAKADSCDGERVLNEGLCRVEESNEDNNVASLSLSLPAGRPDTPPLVTITAPANGYRQRYDDNEGAYWFAIDSQVNGTSGGR